jgi:hypothetical protein
MNIPPGARYYITITEDCRYRIVWSRYGTDRHPTEWEYDNPRDAAAMVNALNPPPPPPPAPATTANPEPPRRHRKGARR